MSNAVVSRHKFRKNYRCYSFPRSVKERSPNFEYGNKIILPPAALGFLTQINAGFPFMFKMSNVANKVSTHVGVLEFVAEDGKAYAPNWLMENLCIQEGNRVKVETVTLPVAMYTCLQPQSVDFLDITNPKAVLENTLRNFSCLTVGDIICIYYNDHEYKLKVISTRPRGAVKIIECDMEVDFEKPVGYVEESSSKTDIRNATVPSQDFVPFGGKGYSLSGKRKFDDTDGVNDNIKRPAIRGTPDYEYEIGTLIFKRKSTLPLIPCEVKKFSPFQGKGQTLGKDDADIS